MRQKPIPQYEEDRQVFIRDARRLTVNGDIQEEPVGDVDHCATQQAQDVHLSQTLQAVQVRLRGGVANLHSVLHRWTRQSWQKRKIRVRAAQACVKGRLRCTFGEVASDLPPLSNVVVEDDASLVHADAAESLFASEP